MNRLPEPQGREKISVFAVDRSKVYMLQVMLHEKEPVKDIIVPGDRLEETLNEYKEIYPDFKKIYVFDADTKDGVAIIKP